MTAAKVVDASALAAIIFEEPERDAIIALLEGFALHAPFLLEYEIASVCLKKIRRDPANESLYRQAANMLSQFGITSSSIDVSAVAELAIKSSLSAYDASYLWLARTLGVELVTLDTRLKKVTLATFGQ